MTALNRLNPKSLPDVSAIGYSQIVTIEPGRLAVVSGQTGSANGSMPAGLAEQAGNVATKLRAALDALDAGAEDIAIIRIYAVGLDDDWLADAMPPLMAAFEGAAPALTGVGVSALAEKGGLIEVEMTVRLPG